VKGSSALLFYALIAVVFYLLILRPQRRRQRALTSTQTALEPGAEVMLSSGIFGRVASLEDQTVQLEMAPGMVVKVSRQAVVRVVEPDEPDDEPVDTQQDGPPYTHEADPDDEAGSTGRPQ
jgi:preprotein translocase subunit YajC